MSGAQCDVLDQKRAVLKAWKEVSLGEAPVETQADSKNSCYLDVDADAHRSEFPYSLDITSSVPSKALELIHAQPACIGPNCANTVLYILGIDPEVRHTDADTLAAFYSSKNCRKLTLTEPKLPGDVVRIFDKSSVSYTKEVHTFFYLDDDLAFEKRSKEKTDRWTFLSFKDAYKFPEGKIVRFSGAETPISDLPRGRYATFYRCTPLSKQSTHSQ